jgi:antitoxin component of MazEF toxin-antitoxin module
MKLQSQISRTYKDKDYLKTWVIIPTTILKELKWKQNSEVEMIHKNGKLIIELKKNGGKKK